MDCDINIEHSTEYSSFETLNDSKCGNSNFVFLKAKPESSLHFLEHIFQESLDARNTFEHLE